LFRLRGKNATVTVGCFLQSLLESLARPFASFSHYFQLNLTQRPGARLFSVHPFPLVLVFLLAG
jgi:hypothetical protein